MQNAVQKFRNAAGLTQQELAERAGTTQQTLQRVEAGSDAVKLHVAASLARVLGKPLEVIFPAARGALAAVQGNPEALYERVLDSSSSMAETGIDADPRQWFLKCYLRQGGTQVFSMADSQSASRLRGYTVDRDSTLLTPIFIFDTFEHRVLLNMDHVLLCQLMWEPVVWPQSDDKADGQSAIDEDDEMDIEICLASQAHPDPLRFTVEADEPAGDDIGQLADLVFHVDIGVDFDATIGFRDIDGEQVFIRPADLVVMKIPLPLLSEGGAEEDNFDEE